MVPYNTKMWTVPPEMMGPDWMGGFIPPVDLDRAVRGARARLNSPIGLNAEFFYPEAGMSSLPGKLAMNLLGHTRYGVSVVKVAPRTHRIDLSDGSSYRYSSLISTMPLPTLVELIDDVPEAVRRRAASLESVDLVLVDVGTRRMNDGGVHWAYLPDSDVLGFRVSAVHNLSDRMVPKGQGLYTVEVAHSRRRPLPAGSIQDRVVADLVRSGWIAGGGEVTFLRERRLRHGYAIPLVGSRRSSAAIRRALDALDIHSVGRFGEWKYSNMEDALSDGRGVADELALGLPDRAAG
jgi:protoporphyrinogen oxidase